MFCRRAETSALPRQESDEETQTYAGATLSQAGAGLHKPYLTRRRFLELTGVFSAGAVSAEVLGACGFRDSTETGDRSLKIGFLAPAEAVNTDRAKTCFNSLRLAVDQVNATGGIAGRSLTVVREGDSADGRTTAAKLTRLVKHDGVEVLVAPLTEPQRRAAVSVLPGLGTILLDPYPRDGQTCSPYLVTTGQVPSQSVSPMALWVSQNAGSRVYAVHSGDSWSRAALRALQAVLNSQKGTLVGTALVDGGGANVRSALLNVRTVNPDVLWCLLPPNGAERFAEALADVDVHALTVITGWDEISVSAHPGLVAGALTSRPWFMSVSTPESAAFVRQYRNRFGDQAVVNADGEATYDAVHLYHMAVQRARTTSTPAVLRTLREVTFAAPQGMVRIDAATQVMVSRSVIGLNSGKGTIDVHGDLGTARPQSQTCA
jgi:urea transport system substrate-binding protein